MPTSKLCGNRYFAFVKRVLAQQREDQVSFYSAGIAFYLFLALIPAMAVLLSVYSLISEPIDVVANLRHAGDILPAEILSIVETELIRLSVNDRTAGWALLIAFALALYSSSKAMKALITGMNQAYKAKKKRKFIHRKYMELSLTLVSILYAVLVILVIAVMPTALKFMQFNSLIDVMASFGKWMILFVATMTWLAIIYRFAPYRKASKWRWITYGSISGALLIVFSSAALTWYTASFSNLSSTYGSLGAVVLLLFCLYNFGFSVMLGAEINSERELQKARK